MVPKEALEEKKIDAYPQDYRHFDNLIWQVPAWCTALFLVTLIGSNSLSETHILATHNFQYKGFAELFSCAYLYLSPCTLTRCIPFSNSSNLNKAGSERPFAWHIFSAQVYLQFVVTLQASVILALFLNVIGMRVLWLVLIAPGLLLVLTTYREIKVWKRKSEKRILKMSKSGDSNLADWYHERIEAQFNDFLNELTEDETIEVAVVLNNSQRILATWFGYHNPNMIIVHGKDQEDNDVSVLLPQTNIQIVMTKIKKGKNERKISIGFQSRNKKRE